MIIKSILVAVILFVISVAIAYISAPGPANAMTAERLGVHIYAQREDLFNAMHRI